MGRLIDKIRVGQLVYLGWNTDFMLTRKYPLKTVAGGATY